jgi:large subunit ribosomal protein L4
MELSVVNIQGKPTGTKVTLAADIFGIEPSDHAIYLDARLLQARQRQGTAKTKDRSEVEGSTAKIYRQKGTGNARHGAKRAGIFVKGGTFHGPKPRDYSFKLNKKLRRLARKSALTYKAQDNRITVLDVLAFDAPKTKAFLEVLTALNMAEQKVLVVTPANESNVVLSGRNLPNVAIMKASDLNTADILHADHLVMSVDSLALVHETLA